MELFVFDLDGTLLNEQSSISPFTAETLQLMAKNDIAFTIATGRTMGSAQNIIKGHHFPLPHIYSNGVITWNPNNNAMQLENCLTSDEAHDILHAMSDNDIAPFISAVDQHQQHFIFYAELHTPAEQQLLNSFSHLANSTVLPIRQMHADISVTNISMIGDGHIVDQLHQEVNTHEHLIAYSGPALEGQGLKWMDVHHQAANKGSAITQLKQQLNAEKVICFGDSDNDLSMFAIADESYAPANAKADIQAAVDDVLGYHYDDSVAHYLRERLGL